ncbi:AAA family ATPase [Lacticaseibacillus absianus]|uniref:AAA family ATPase n=1 Tax=Lacticaseibacillus absianus TaxID=2729623 RepID=UPI0015C7C47F|nr:AAA family ATPase [Lacticaseibacillus absianus]
MPTLILLRGNSGCGKTTLADALARAYGEEALLLQQDVLRRHVLHAGDHAGTHAVDLIADLIDFGRQFYPITIVEGILRRDVYGAMLQRAIERFGARAFVYYLDLPFALTVVRNAPRHFSEVDLRCWWRPTDQLGPTDIRLSDRPVTTNLARIRKAVGR